MCRSSSYCMCDNEDGPFERKIKEGLPNMLPSPCLPEPDFQVPEPSVSEQSSLVSELLQSQLALWTFSLSTILTYIWQSRKRCLAFNLFLLLPAGLAATAALSAALALFVSLGRFLFPASRPDQPQASPVAEWVVKRLPTALDAPNAASAGFLRRRRSLAAQHSLRSRRARALTALLPPTNLPAKPEPDTKAKGYFWQRKHSMERSLPPAAASYPHRLGATHFRG